MSDETTKALINNLPAILTAVAAVVAAIAAAVNLIRTGKMKAEGRETRRQVDKAVASSARNATKLAELHGAVTNTAPAVVVVDNNKETS